MRNPKIQNAVASWSAYVKAKLALLNSNYIRSYKSAEGDFAEWLVATILNGELVGSKSNQHYDVVAGNKRIQVRSVTKMWDNPNGYGIHKRGDRDNDPHTGATHYAFVFFDELCPDAIFLVPEGLVRKFPKEQIKRADLDGTKFRLDVDLTPFRNAMSREKT